MRINPPTLFWILIAAILAADHFLPVFRFPVFRFAERWLPWCGGALVLLGIAISAAGKKQFQHAGTNVYTFEEPGELTTVGLYSVSRNPMYLGLVIAGFGAAAVSATLASLILSGAFAVVVRYWYIAYEERAMGRKFGARYDDYRRQVGRWLGRRRRIS